MSTDIFFNPIWDIRITDTSLRDGSHHKRHQFTKDEVHAIVSAEDKRFFLHAGLDPFGIAKATYVDLKAARWWATMP